MYVFVWPRGWKAAQKCVYARFDKEIRKFGMIATRCMKTTSNVFIRCLLNTQCFEEILLTEVLSTSVRQFHVTHTERQSTYDSYTRSIKRIEYPQCIDHHYMMSRRIVDVNLTNIDFDDTTVIYDVHPAYMVANDCVITNMYKAIYEGNEQNGLNIYTDASASSYGKGWSVVIYRRGFRIANKSGSIVNGTVYEAELNAILQAVKYVNEEASMSRIETVEIRSECQAAVQTLRKYVQHESLQKEIHDELRKASEKSKRIRIRWIPGHSDVGGNEDADRTAKKAVDSIAMTEIRKTQRLVKNLVKQKRIKDINSAWEESVSVQTKAFLPMVKDVHKFVASSPSPALCQIVSGHTRLNDFICRKLKLIDSAKCKCGTDDETVTHYLFDCPLYLEIRSRIWPDINVDYECVTRDWEKLSKYVEETGRFKGRHV